jgi:hypothetical protein
MFTGTNHRLSWLVAAPAAVAFTGLAVFLWALEKAGAGLQIVSAGATAMAIAAQFLLVERVRARDRQRMLDLLRVLNRPGDLRE